MSFCVRTVCSGSARELLRIRRRRRENVRGAKGLRRENVRGAKGLRRENVRGAGASGRGDPSAMTASRQFPVVKTVLFDM